MCYLLQIFKGNFYLNVQYQELILLHKLCYRIYINYNRFNNFV